MLNANQTSVYHNQSSMLEDDIIIPDHNDIPAIKQKQLFGTSIDSITRSLNKDDFLDQTIFPVYSNNKIGFQCIQTTELTIDTISKPCGPSAYNLLPFNKL